MVNRLNQKVSRTLWLPAWASWSITIGLLLIIASLVMFLAGLNKVFYVPVLIAGAILLQRIGFYKGNKISKGVHEIEKDSGDGRNE
ncbi:hypothetical protein LJR221_004107 [Agrobacterium tumefaciens]